MSAARAEKGNTCLGTPPARKGVWAAKSRTTSANFAPRGFERPQRQRQGQRNRARLADTVPEVFQNEAMQGPTSMRLSQGKGSSRRTTHREARLGLQAGTRVAH